MTTSTPPPAEGFQLKRPNRWPAGRRFRQRHLHAFQIDQRIGSIVLAVAVSLLINGLAFWQLYTAKPPPLPVPEPEPVIVMLGEPDPDPEALTDLMPPEAGVDAGVRDVASLPAREPAPTPVPSARETTPPLPAPEVAEARPTPAPAPAPDAPPPAPSPPEPVADVAETIEVTLPPPAPAVAATAQDLTDLPAETGEVLAADVASPEPGPQPSPGNVQTEADAVTSVDAPVSEADVAPVETVRPPSLPPDAADRLARVLESPTVEVELPTLPSRAAAEPLRALPPQLRSSPERAPLPEPDVAVAEAAIAPEVPAPPPTLPPQTADPEIEQADPTRPELVVEPLSPDAPVVQPAAPPVAPPVNRAVTRAELPEPERLSPTVTPRVAPLAPTVAVPEPRRPVLEAASSEPPRIELPLAVRPPAAPPPVALPPTRAEPERVRPAAVAVDLPRERPALAAPAPAPRAALPPAVERGPDATEATARAAPALDREALQVAPQAPTRLDPALLAGEGETDPAASAAPAAGSDADFGLPEARPGAADGLDWSDSIRAATRDQVAEESAARRAARAPWQRDEAWFADDPPARMEQMLRDDPNLAKLMVDFLVGALVGGSEQTPRTLYEVGPDPGVLVQLWLDRHHGDLQLACRREAAAMPEAAQRVLCPGERTEALKFDAVRPAGD